MKNKIDHTVAHDFGKALQSSDIRHYTEIDFLGRSRLVSYRPALL
jgi:hypothetical protein